MVDLMRIRRLRIDNPRFRFHTCCGTIHTKIAMTAISVLFILFDIIEAIQYIFSASWKISAFTFFGEVLEALILISLMVGCLREKAVLLIPFLTQLLIANVMMAIMVAISLYGILAPSSSAIEAVGPLYGDDATRRLYFALLFFFSLLILSIFTWFLKVGFLTYVFFEDQRLKQLIRHSRHVPRTMVTGDGEQKDTVVTLPPRDPQDAQSPIESFANPNFSLSDEEDDVFSPSGRSRAVIV